MAIHGFVDQNGSVQKYDYASLENVPSDLVKDADLDVVIAVQDSEPTDEKTKLWIKETSGDGVQIPTYEEFLEVKEDTDDLKNVVTNLQGQQYEAFATDTASGSIVSFADGADNVPVKNLTIAIELAQSGSGDPSPNNIRPISGWSSANVTKCGANLFPYKNIDTQTKNGVTFTIEKSDGIITNIHMKGTATEAFSLIINASSDDYWALPKGEYKMYIGGDRPSTSSLFDINVRKRGETKDIVASSGITTITLTEQTLFSSAYIWIYSGAVLDHNVIPVIVRDGTDTSIKYSLIQRQSIAIGLGQTVYGGILNAIAGKLTVDRIAFNLSELNWYYDGDNIFAVNMQSFPIKFMGRGACSHYKVIQTSSWRDIGNMQMSVTNSQAAPLLRIHNDDAGTDAQVFKQSLVGVEFVCETPSPITYNLTPSEVKTLLAQNSIWADCGDTTVEYRADTKLYIDKKIAALAAAMN